MGILKKNYLYYFLLAMAVKLNTCQEAAIFEDEREGKIREVGNQAVWSLSSCKPGKTLKFSYNIEPYNSPNVCLHS